jgi:hypothetical protein
MFQENTVIGSSSSFHYASFNFKLPCRSCHICFGILGHSRNFAVNHLYGNGPLVMGRMDTTISPGVPSGHFHAVQGENAFALTLTDN